MPDQREDHVFCGNAERELAFKLHAHDLGPTLDQRLRRQHVGELARSDTESQRTQSAMSTGVAVTADNRASRQAQPKLRPNDMDDTLSGLVDVEKLNAAGRSFCPKRRQQLLADLASTGAAACRRNGMVWGSKGQFRTVNLETAPLEIKQSPRAAEIVQ